MLKVDLHAASPETVGIDPAALEALCESAARDVAGRPGAAAQLAVARHGRLAGFSTFGSARFGGDDRPADAQSLFCVFSVTKAIVSSAVWILLQEGKLGIEERVSDIVPEFGSHGKQRVQVEHLLTHTAGFPEAPFGPLDWEDRERRLERFAQWRLDWEPGSRFVYHGSSSMWVLAEILERRSGSDFRAFVRARISEPLGLSDLYLGLPASENGRVADVVCVGDPPTREGAGSRVVDAPVLSDDTYASFNRPAVRAVGAPGGGAIATAASVALFYQALIADAAGRGPGIWKHEMLAEAFRVRRPHLIDPMTRQPALRGLGVVVAGETGKIWRGFAEALSPRSIGHMGAGGQIAWADPDDGLSFAYCTNAADRDPARQGAKGLALSSLAAACVSTPRLSAG